MTDPAHLWRVGAAGHSSVASEPRGNDLSQLTSADCLEVCVCVCFCVCGGAHFKGGVASHSPPARCAMQEAEEPNIA